MLAQLARLAPPPDASGTWLYLSLGAAGLVMCGVLLAYGSGVLSWPKRHR